MTLAERVNEIDHQWWRDHGRHLAMHCAIWTIAGEPDPQLRPTLYEDLGERMLATLLAQAITDAQADLVKQAFETASERYQHAFERPLVREEFRQPPPRRKA